MLKLCADFIPIKLLGISQAESQSLLSEFGSQDSDQLTLPNSKLSLVTMEEHGTNTAKGKGSVYRGVLTVLCQACETFCLGRWNQRKDHK